VVGRPPTNRSVKGSYRTGTNLRHLVGWTVTTLIANISDRRKQFVKNKSDRPTGIKSPLVLLTRGDLISLAINNNNNEKLVLRH